MVLSASRPPTRDPLVELERRVATDGSRAFITWYDLDRGFRTELSGRTVANWVDKSANLLVSMDVAEFPRVANTVLASHPGHWVGLVWTMAVWQLGGHVLAVGRQELDSTDQLDAAVVGPQDAHPVPGLETIACSLHPLGAGFEDHPSGVTDNVEVLSQPDVHWRVPASRPVCFETESVYGWTDLARVEPSSERLLVIPGDDPWQTVCRTLVAPLLGGGSTVIVVGGEPRQIASVADQERARLDRPKPANE